ncbi:MAG: type II toxin-antitoxin system Phd/YefM family antitoxin [Thermodesulfobacteriota bacterium]|nr:type II toxin-antitoxin system Phd/YefM family antitoxin [Thermodesulfobacteriota bacterium]
MEISAAQFRTNCFKILDDVNLTHREVIITKRGKPIAKLISYNQGKACDPLIGAMVHQGETLNNLIEPFEDVWELD